MTNPTPTFTNQLYYGDNLKVLRDKIASDSVDLVYLDPPFNSNADYSVIFKDKKGQGSDAQFQAFKDTWHWGEASETTLLRDIPTNCPPRVVEASRAIVDLLGRNDLSAYLIMMIPRLVELRRVLKPTGSLYLHCDPTASHYLKMVLDAIFGFQCFRSEIIWKRSSAHSDTKQGAKQAGRVHDVLLFYSKSNSTWLWNPVYRAYETDYIDSNYRYVEEGTNRRFKSTDLTAAKPGGNTSYEWKGRKPPNGRYWAYSIENMQKFEAANLLYYTNTGLPRLKQFLDEMPGVALQDIWDDIPPISSQAKERLGYPTQKPLALLERIINASSKPGDIVLDPFAGCGTTVHASQKLGRHWIGIDITSLAIVLVEQRLRVAFPDIKFTTVGFPKDLEGAKKLAQDDKHQFEWWALSLVKAKPSGEGDAPGKGKKGADGGKDGYIYFNDTDGKLGKVIVSVKGGANVGVEMVRSLGDVVDEQKAQIGVLITLTPPTKPMQDWAVQKGLFHSNVWGDFPKIQLLTVEQLLNGAKIRMPTTTVADTFATPRRETKKPAETQATLMIDD